MLAVPEKIARAVADYTVILIESRIPIGTGQRAGEVIRATLPALAFGVAFNSEFLRERNATADFMCPDRVVIAAESGRVREILDQPYRPRDMIEASIVFTGIESPELTRYAAGAFPAILTWSSEHRGSHIQLQQFGPGFSGSVLAVA